MKCSVSPCFHSWGRILRARAPSGLRSGWLSAANSISGKEPRLVSDASCPRHELMPAAAVNNAQRKSRQRNDRARAGVSVGGITIWREANPDSIAWTKLFLCQSEKTRARFHPRADPSYHQRQSAPKFIDNFLETCQK